MKYEKSKMQIKNKKEEFKRRLYKFVLTLLQFIKLLPKDQVNKVITDQLIRSGTSVLANYIEAQSASSRKDYVNFFTYSLKSANESKMWLALLRDTGCKDKKEIEDLIYELKEISDIFASSIITLKGKRNI